MLRAERLDTHVNGGPSPSWSVSSLKDNFDVGLFAVNKSEMDLGFLGVWRSTWIEKKGSELARTDFSLWDCPTHVQRRRPPATPLPDAQA